MARGLPAFDVLTPLGVLAFFPELPRCREGEGCLRSLNFSGGRTCNYSHLSSRDWYLPSPPQHSALEITVLWLLTGSIAPHIILTRQLVTIYLQIMLN